MERVEKTVFISYRRTSIPWAIAIFQNLKQDGFDVFFDFEGVASGDFERVILENIKARAHFLVLLTPSALDRCSDPTDWLRREIEVAINNQRNIVPIMLEGFHFGMREVTNQLTGRLAELKRYNALDVPTAYFTESMDRLRNKYLNISLDAVLHPISPFVQQATKKQQSAAYAVPTIQKRELTGQIYFEHGNAKDDVAAASSFNKAADSGDPFDLKKYLLNRKALGDRVDFREYFPNLKAPQAGNLVDPKNLDVNKAPDAGDPEDFRKYFRNLKVPQAGNLLSPKNLDANKAPHAGEPVSMTNLGFIYERGQNGLSKDDAQAAYWYRKAADAGEPFGMNNLGLLYLDGRGGLPKDDAQALQWFRRAVDAGHRAAMANLAFMYENGRGVP